MVLVVVEVAVLLVFTRDWGAAEVTSVKEDVRWLAKEGRRKLDWEKWL